MLGDWGGNEEGMVRVAPDTGDFHIEKDRYKGIEESCLILKTEKLADNLYTVESRCENYYDAMMRTDEFELKDGRLFINGQSKEYVEPPTMDDAPSWLKPKNYVPRPSPSRPTLPDPGA
jgi:hypothetical protein